MKHTTYTCDICTRTDDHEPSMSNFIAVFSFHNQVSRVNEISKINDVCVNCRAEITKAVRLAVNEVKARKGVPDKYKRERCGLDHIDSRQVNDFIFGTEEVEKTQEELFHDLLNEPDDI